MFWVEPVTLSEYDKYPWIAFQQMDVWEGVVRICFTKLCIYGAF